MSMKKAEARHERIEARLKLLEVEAQLQRTTLASLLLEFEQRRSLAWLGTAAKVAGSALKAPSMRWMLVSTALRVLRRKHHEKSAA